MSKEYPCVYYENEKCKKFSENGVTSYCVQGPCGHEMPSNADRIRAMTDEEWAYSDEFPCPYVDELGECKFGDGPMMQTCQECKLEWLQQPVKDGADHE